MEYKEKTAREKYDEFAKGAFAQRIQNLLENFLPTYHSSQMIADREDLSAYLDGALEIHEGNQWVESNFADDYARIREIRDLEKTLLCRVIDDVYEQAFGPTNL